MTAPIDAAKTVFLFPGVGAQRPDMFAEFRAFPEYRTCIEEVSEVAGVDLLAAIHGDQRQTLGQVRIAQLALTATTIGVARVLRHHCGLVPDFVMGHSLGQYPALCAAGYLELTTLIRIVSLRSEVVTSCAQDFEHGEMCWVLHIPAEVVVEAVAQARSEGMEVHVSAIDAFDQVTVSAEMSEIRRFASRIEAMGGLLYPLKIGGPFHSPLMMKAQEMLGRMLEPVLKLVPEGARQSERISRLVCNVTGGELLAERLESSILEHLVSPGRWLQSLQSVAEQGVTRYLEISPKPVLSYLAQRAGLPMRSLCEPDELFEFTRAHSSGDHPLRRFCLRSYAHLFGLRLPDLEDAATIDQLRRIRAEVKRRVASSRPSREECGILYRCTQQWLDILASRAGIDASVEKAALASLYESALYDSVTGRA
jgi:[acyl-carrier-protein] S-malonyltransferase